MIQWIPYLDTVVEHRLFFAVLEALVDDKEDLVQHVRTRLETHVHDYPKHWLLHQSQPVSTLSSYGSDIASDDSGLSLMVPLALYLYVTEGVDSAKMTNTRLLVKQVTLLTHDSPIVYLGHLLFVVLLLHLFHTKAKPTRHLSTKALKAVVDHSICDWLTLLEHQPEQKFLSYYVRFAAQIGDRNRLDKPSTYIGKLSVGELHHRNHVVDTLERMFYRLLHSTYNLFEHPFESMTESVMKLFESLIVHEERLLDPLLNRNEKPILRLKQKRYQWMYCQSTDCTIDQYLIRCEQKRLDISQKEMKTLLNEWNHH